MSASRTAQRISERWNKMFEIVFSKVWNKHTPQANTVCNKMCVTVTDGERKLYSTAQYTIYFVYLSANAIDNL